MGRTIDKYGKLSGWIAPVGVLLCLLAVITAQPGFLNIDCGGRTNRTVQNNVTWVTDANYIRVGQTTKIISRQAYGSYLHNLRFFPKPLNKCCYELPVVSNVPHLLRLWFALGNYKGFKQLPISFAFSIETLGMLAMVNITISNRHPKYYEEILVSASRVLYVCLIRNGDTDDPFINAIELRMLQDGMYEQAKRGTMLYSTASVSRYNVGGYSMVRYPQDCFDRIWRSNLYLDGEDIFYVYQVHSEQAISTNNIKDLPPPLVMQTAWVMNLGNFEFDHGSSTNGHKSLLLLYFADIEMTNMSTMLEPRSFYLKINGEKRSESISLVGDAVQKTFVSNETDDFQFSVVPDGDSPGPIINAFEYYEIIETQQATYSLDVEALDAIKSRFDIKDWISDPCFLIQWKGIACDNSSSALRISEIDLSRRNLTGSVPQDIGQLTALMKVSLDNNHLMGPLPNFSNLTKLEKLYIQNNNLSGIFPSWLGELENLKELNVENNNFSGVIPAQLLKGSVKLNYCGNPYLNMHKGECTILLNSNKSYKLKVVLGSAISGILIITLALMVGIIMYRNKFRGRKQGVATERNLVQMERRSVQMEGRSYMYQDYSMIMVPNPTKSRAFSLDEMMVATQNFSRVIGRGGFGLVFFGKLPQGIDIAVKVLSRFSEQGIHEFLNEVDLLSRVHHRNLVSLLGYCNESGEVMLIYEHMSGGSLKDHLYDPIADHSELNWKTRLKIILDAAHGLEYLHVGCTPKIIHRDIKTANILLDSSLNGKLADFGLSKIAIDGEATHVTTAVKGTAGYLDPEYFATQMLTHKSDVYSFGVVLLEIICGRQPIDLKLPAQELNIIRWVKPYVLDLDENPGKIVEIIDKRLGGGYDMNSITRVAKVAMRCVEAETSSRPSVTEVVEELKEAIKHEDKVSLSIPEETGVGSSVLLAGPVYLSVDSSDPKGMEGSDNSSNFF